MSENRPTTFGEGPESANEMELEILGQTALNIKEQAPPPPNQPTRKTLSTTERLSRGIMGCD
jgi:hypothetical protein